uniref:Subtilisin-like protease SBT1.8 n=1 Tax=Nicotiana tabacum TaxID=4097 RepID=A0A1S3YPY3_TOBAC|nr:PREDICTED: subtilisin-like protease SBT1.8 [Nicotiana tabacum]
MFAKNNAAVTLIGQVNKAERRSATVGSQLEANVALNATGNSPTAGVIKATAAHVDLTEKTTQLIDNAVQYEEQELEDVDVVRSADATGLKASVGLFNERVMTSVAGVIDNSNTTHASAPIVPLDEIALGAYSATERGILVSCSAGNSGPSQRTVANDAPWILTVGASTHDRKLKATVKLGNKEEFEGESAYHPKTSNSTFFTLFDVEKIVHEQFDAPFCVPGSLTDPSIRGKIVVCLVGGGVSRVNKGQVVKDAGGVGMILINNPNDGVTKSAEAHVLPALDVSDADGKKILAYINSTSNPVAAITFRGTVLGDKNAPIVASFSSRGPSEASRGILKPDIIGPGVNVLAAWPTSVDNNKNTKSTFNIISGTSMSCPHLSGIAALLKSAHPDWSPAAIKSAIMTTTYTLNLAKNPILDERLIPADIFAIGAGHVNPSRANDPGLVYDTPFEDYVPYLCGLNYTNREVGKLLQGKVNCSEVKSIPEAQLNYPSFSIRLRSTPQTYTRTVTNVGNATSIYKVEIVSPKGIAVKVKPSKLNFSILNQKLTYQVTFTKTTNNSDREVGQGFLKWNSNRHSVSSPIAVVLLVE